MFEFARIILICKYLQLNISVLVLVKDVNDNAPVFDQEKYSVDIPEELPIGELVVSYVLLKVYL